MKCSVIIPTCGRPDAVKVAIRSLLAIQPARLDAEIVVVDNNDDPALCADLRAACGDAGRPVRYVAEPSPGLGAARHAGAREARGECLIYVDDDVEVSPTWLAAIMEAFRDPRVALVGGPSIPRFTSTIPTWLWNFVDCPAPDAWCCAWLSLMDLGDSKPDIDPNAVWGLNFSIRRDALLQLGGFHPDVVPTSLQRWQGDGETGLTMKARAIGLRAVYSQDALLFHVIGADRLTPEYFARRAYYQAVCDSYTHIRAGNAPAADSIPIADWVGTQQDRWLAQAQPVRARARAAYAAGWTFHQREAAADPHLMAWIRREHYWDADIRDELARRAR